MVVLRWCLWLVALVLCPVWAGASPAQVALTERIDGAEVQAPGPSAQALSASLPADALPAGVEIAGEVLALRWEASPLGPEVHHYTAEISVTLRRGDEALMHVIASGQGNHFQGPFAARRALRAAGAEAARLILARVEAGELVELAPTTRGVRTPSSAALGVAKSKGPLYRRSVAVIIGINHYPHIGQDLEYAESDARRVGRFFKSQGFEVHTLLGAQATRQRISTLIGDTLPTWLKGADRVVVYFAGHGLTEGKGPSTMGYLAARDTDERRPRATGVSMLALQRWLSHLPARHVMLLTDACYAGLAINTRAGPPLQGVEAPRWLRLALEGRAQISLVAGRRGELAHELDGAGVFTAVVLEGLRGAADVNLDGFITGDELAVYVKPQVIRRVLQAVNAPQRPQYARTGEGEMVFRVPGGR